MKRNLRHAVARNMLIESHAFGVIDRFAQAGIPSILLKGPTFAKWLYDTSDPRFYTDADVLVPYSEFQRAEKVLRGLGFDRPPDLPQDKPWHAHEWVRHADGAAIDLHRTLLGARAGPEKVWDVLSRHRVEEEISGRSVTCLDLDARALHVVLHAAANGPAHAKVIEDMRRALERVTVERWGAVRALAQELDALPALAIGLRLSEEGTAVAARLGLEEQAPIDTILRASSAPPTSLGIDWFLRLPGWSSKATFLRHKLFPSREYMLSWRPLARRGRLGLVLAYLWRPLWELMKLPPAVRAYVRGRRAARRQL